MKHLRISLLLLFLVLPSCVYHNNPRLAQYDPAGGYRYETIPRKEQNTESLFVVLALSGGGTRAAALSYGVLEELRDTKIKWKGEEKFLLDEVDVISGVSGGSFTAAYYSLFGERVFKDFEEQVLKRNITRDLVLRALLPHNLIRLMGSNFNRIDLASRHYDKQIFDQKTFGQLLAQKGPYLILNATDAPRGSRFEFTQDQFDPICSDLSRVKIATAVAASSAFPGLLSPITFENYGGSCRYREPLWISSSIQPGADPRRVSYARRVRSYSDRATRPYIHLIDGGVADNIGVRPVIEALILRGSPWSIMRLTSIGRIEKLVVIVVNAKTYGASEAEMRRKPPNIFNVFRGAAFSTMGNYSFESVALLKDVLDVKRVEAKAYGEKIPDLTAIEVGFASLAFSDPAEYSFFASVPTTLHLPDGTVDRLREIGGRLLRTEPEFRKLCDHIGVPGENTPCAP